jgi:hypothetical protein
MPTKTGSVKSYKIETHTARNLEVRLDGYSSDGSVYVQMRKKGTSIWLDVLHFTREGKLARVSLSDSLGLKTIEKADGESVFLMLRAPE